MPTSEPLPVVDGLTLSMEHRRLLRPGEAVRDPQGRTHLLPRYFHVLQSWQQARDTRVAPHFTLSELMSVDCREARLLLRRLPHFVPCAVTILARYLEEFRLRVNAPVMLSVNGGYRSPSHQFSGTPGPHLWATAADIYRIGDTWLDDARSIRRFARIAESIGPEVFVKPYGHGPGETDDHLHFDIGYVHVVPRGLDEAAHGHGNPSHQDDPES